MPATRTRRRARASILLTFALLLTMLVVLPGAADHQGLGGSQFESEDGNLETDDDAAHIDWETVGFESQSDKPSGSDDDSFGQGASEDTACPSVVSGSIPPNKSDLESFGLYVEDGSFLHMFWTRVQDPKGTTNMDFEFNQNDPDEDPCSNGVSPVRAAGDALISYNLSKGGTKPFFFLHRWLTDGTDAKAECESNSSFPCWSAGVELGGNDAAGSVNTTEIDGIPGVDGPLDAFTFGEGSIDLSAVFSEDDCLNFGSAYLKSRSSDSFTSALKDFIAPLDFELQNCGSLKVEKEDDTGADLAGAKFKVYLDDGDGVAELGGDDTQVGSECTTTSDGTGDCTFDDLLFGDYWVDETEAPAGHDPDPEGPKLVTVDGPTVFTVTFTNARQTGSIVVEKVDEDDDLLAGADFEITEKDGDDLDPVLDMDEFADGVFCTDGLLFADYTVNEATVPDGYTGAADATVTVDSASTCDDRIDDTTGLPVGDADVEFTNASVPGQIDILKEDDLGNPLQGVTFQLFDDDDGKPGDAVAGLSCTTGSDGQCSITDVPLGDYWLDETNLPDGYSADADLPESVTVGLGDAPGDGQTLSFDFVNPQLHDVRLIVCHSGTNELAASDFWARGDSANAVASLSRSDLDGLSLSSEQRAAVEAFLCGTDAFDDYGHGDADFRVDVGNEAH